MSDAPSAGRSPGSSAPKEAWIGLRERAVAALDAHVRAERDPVRVTPACLALCRLGGLQAVEAVRAACVDHSPRLDREVLPALRAATLDDLPAATGAVERAGLLLDVGRSAEALRLLDAALEARPDDVAARLARVRARLDRGEKDGALEDARRAVSLAPGVATLVVLGDVQRAREDHAGAEETYSKVLAQDADHVAARLDRGVSRLARGDVAGAEEDFRGARQRDPLLAVAWVNEGLCLERRGALVEAEVAFSRAIDLAPAEAHAVRARGHVRLTQGRLPEAIADLRRALELDPADAISWSNLGLARLRARDAEGAVGDYGRAIELAPSHAGFRFNRGQALRDLRRHEAALADLTKAVELDPRHVDARGAKAIALLELGRLPDAIVELDRAIELDPGHLINRFNRASVWKRLGDLSRSRPDLEEVASRDPGFSRVWFDLGLARLVTGEPALAAAALLRAQAVAPTDPLPFIAGGLAHYAAGEPEPALRALGRVAGLRVEAALWLASIGGSTDALKPVAPRKDLDGAIARWHLGQLDDQGLLAAAELVPESRRIGLRRAYLHLGVVAARAGRAEQARKHLTRSLEVDPGDEPVESAVAKLLLARLGR